MQTDPHNIQSERPQSLFRNHNFIFLWSAYAISAMGDHLSEMAILKSLNAANPDVDVTPISARMSFMFFLPFFLLAPVTGLLADRLPRRGLMIAADVIRCVIMFAFGTLIARTAPWGTWGPFVPLAVVGVFAAVFSPARSALLPTLIRSDQLVRANGMIAGLGIIATMAANQIGGTIAQHYEPHVAFRLDAGTFLASAVFLFLIRAPRGHSALSKPATNRTPLRDISAGFWYVRCHRRVAELLIIMALVWFCGALVNSAIPAVVRDVYQGNYQSISSYRALIGLGFLIGASVVTLLGDSLKSEIAVTWGLLGVGVGIAILTASWFLGLEPSTLARIGAVGVVVAGTFAVATMAGTSALLQRSVADRFRGRVFGVNDLFSIGALLTATGALGIPQGTRIDRYVGFILAAVAALTFTAGLVTLVIRLRRGRLGAALTLGENLNEFICKYWWRFRRLGRATVPRNGPVIIASNHGSAPDPLFICASAPYRAIAFMIAREFAGWPIVRFFVRTMGCIPVTRSGQDTAAFKRAIRHLQAGNALCIFIEGKIVKPDEVAQPRDGVAMLARETDATVVPAHISGTNYRESIVRSLFGRHRARVVMGRPMTTHELFGDATDRSSREALRTATQRIYTAIQSLPQSTRGA